MTGARLTHGERHQMLLEQGATLFASRPYDEVRMDQLAELAGISRALLYRHFASKGDLFAQVYQQAADRLVVATTLDPAASLPDQLAQGLDAHIDYFVANRRTVLAANRTLAGDPRIQAIITGELDVLRTRLLDSLGLAGPARQTTSAVLMSWLVFVRVLCVEWLAEPMFDRQQLRDTCIGALLGALGAPITTR